MDFDAAIRAHAEWKLKLSTYLAKPDGSLKAAEIARDSLCPLGAWLQGEAVKLTTLPELATLRDAHRRFHLAAADVVRRADQGGKVTAEITLGAQSDFARASSAIVQALMAMKRSAAR